MAKRHLLTFAFVFAALIACVTPVFAQTPAPAPVVVDPAAKTPAPVPSTKKPTLTIPIPNLTFSDIKVEESGGTRYLDIPWLAQYISAVYRYAIDLAMLLSTVMFMVGGFLYLTAGGDASRAKAGKQRISDAIVGLLLALGAYTILRTVNPDALTLSTLRIEAVKKTLLEQVDRSIRTTTEPTRDAAGVSTGGIAKPGSGPGNIGNPVSRAEPPASAPTQMSPPSSPGYAGIYSSCPFTDEQLGGTPKDAPDGPRGQSFRSKMRGILTGDQRTKINMTAQAGVACKVHYGSCGSHSATWWAIAGVGPDQLGDNNPSVGGNTAWGGTSHEPPRAIALKLLDIACGTECEGDEFGKQCGEARCTVRQARGAKGKMTNFYKVTNDCYGKKDAADEARALMSGPGGPAGWPDSWTSKLEVGDIIWIYNGNASCGAQHAEVFLGWAGGGKGVVAAGQYNGPQWTETVCLMRACGRFQVVTRIFKPR